LCCQAHTLSQPEHSPCFKHRQTTPRQLARTGHELRQHDLASDLPPKHTHSAQCSQGTQSSTDHNRHGQHAGNRRDGAHNDVQTLDRSPPSTVPACGAVTRTRGVAGAWCGGADGWDGERGGGRGESEISRRSIPDFPWGKQAPNRKVEAGVS
jgi:hypothetical protein